MQSRNLTLAIVLALTLLASACAPQAASSGSSVPVTGPTSAPVPAYGGGASQASSPTQAPAAMPTQAAAAMPTQAPASSSGGAYGGGYGYGDNSSSTQAPSSGSGSSASAGGAQVAVAQNGSLGSILVDSKGMTLYLYTKDTQNSGASTCYGQCATFWPALTTSGAPAAGSGLDDSKFGTITRTDGTTQVTYNGWPLYYYAKDKQAGDVNGQKVGGVWFVVSPSGDAVQ
jgi:predicted lipoprotein with Yx(FWY)xxD motif